MLGCHRASSALMLSVVLLVGASFIPRSTQIPIDAPAFDGSRMHSRAAPPGLAGGTPAGDTTGRGDEMSSSPKGGEEGEEEEEDDELFKDVDPKTLAALLLEALNKPQAERRRTDGGERTEEARAEPAEATTTKAGEAARAAERENRDREDRDGRHELELVMAAAAAQGKEERERQEEEERKTKQEEEERMTERVTSRTTSQTVQPVKKTEQAPNPSSDGGGEEAGAPPARPRAPAAATGDPRQSDGEEEEEQLSPEEVQNLERMMKKFQSFSSATKRERDSQAGERESRGGFSPYNEHKGATSKKKLKWQEETMKAMHVPTFKGGNFMDDFQDADLDDDTAQSPPPPENDRMEQDEPEGEEEEDEEEEEEEVLSPAEEEARAKAEQEEVRRQAAEAQRAKVEEEKLADMASDMLLRYMVKQNGGGRKYGKKYSSPQSNNAAEDKRSDEEQEAAADEDDDIDPQTIDKLIEISSKLHLPADDVVDIISDVEKKKKKDVALEMGGLAPPPRQRPVMMPASSSSQSSSSSLDGISPSRTSSKQDAANPLKAWFLQETPPRKAQSLAGEEFWTKPQQKPLSSTAQDFWLKPQKSFRAGYNTPYTPYTTSYYQQKPYRGYYPIYYPPPPPQNAKPRYYHVPKPALTLDDLLGGGSTAADDYDNYNFGPKRRFRNWVQVRPRKPPTTASLRRNPYYADYVYSSYPRTFQQAPPALPKLRSPPRLQGGGAAPRRRSGFYYRPHPAPAVTRGGDYYYDGQRGNQADGVDADDRRLESYIQQILMKRPQLVQ